MKYLERVILGGLVLVVVFLSILLVAVLITLPWIGYACLGAVVVLLAYTIGWMLDKPR